MFAQLLRTASLPISLVALLVGFGLILSGYLPLGIAGGVLIVLAFFVPFLRLAVVPDRSAELAAERERPEATPRDTDGDRTVDQSETRPTRTKGRQSEAS